ncbi:uncharacterized protein LOC126900234 [Daktulosphaira vitifoliae]|uniref:uncharacterized protein LOC126900234 n=1 Tax=Daktulosphaira vitifoliae TaxID=58002 RepID=UPI0021AA0C68|nr:uncharacterized protein LOC126900234 [Daktulosphaira vitifoliae]
MVDPNLQARDRATLKRTVAIKGIRSILEVGVSAVSQPNLVTKFVAMTHGVDDLWKAFQAQNDLVLDALVILNESSNFPTELESEVFDMVSEISALMAKFNESNGNAINGNIDDGDLMVTLFPGQSFKNNKLPKIPLPMFSGKFIDWPSFSGRFLTQIYNNTSLSNDEKYYYLCGCVSGEALNVIKGFHMSPDCYKLAWNALEAKYNKPRQLANLLVEKLISASPLAQENVSSLNDYVELFEDNISLLRSLSIPDVGEFILFTLAVRCLPLSSRKLFEATNIENFPDVESLFMFIRERIRVLENAGGRYDIVGAKVDQRKQFSKPKKEYVGRVSFVAAKSNAVHKSVCSVCSGSHISSSCSRLPSTSLKDRQTIVRKKKLCFNCLGINHWTDRCLSTDRCAQCGQKHHTLLHFSKETEREDMPVALSTVSSIINTHEVLLGTALGHIRDQYGIAHQVRILIDSASQISAMTAACAKRLGLHVAKWTAPVNGLAGVSVPQVQGILKCDVTPRHSDDPSISVQAWILPSITCDIPRRPIPVDMKKRVEHLVLADPTFDVSSSIDVLLGADVYPLVMDGKQVSLGISLPAAFSSIFGWVIIGSVGVASNLNAPQVCVASLSVSLEELVSRFWEVEEPETCGPPVTEDDNCEAIIQKNMNIDDCGRYCVPLPFRHSNSKSLLKGSRKMALKRFENLEKRLCSNETLAEAYRSFMREYESLGHMHETSKVGDYYIPHHAVVKPGLDGMCQAVRSACG